MFDTFGYREPGLLSRHRAALRTQASCDQETYIQNPGSSLKASVFITHLQGKCVVVKNYAGSHPILRATLCKWLLNREITALKALAQHPGVPNMISRYGPFGFAMEFIEGRVLDRATVAQNPMIMHGIAAQIQRMHALGVTHNDIRMRNMLIDQHGRLRILDVGGAVLKPNRFDPLGASLFYLARFSERIKIIKLKLRFHPASINRKDRKLLKFVALSRFISHVWKKYLYKVLTVRRLRR